MLKTAAVALTALATLAVAAPAHAAPKTVQPSPDFALSALVTQETDCYGYRVAQTGTDPGYLANRPAAARTDAFYVYNAARCNPADQRAAVMAHRSKALRAAHNDGLRAGWCFRWVASGARVSATCAATVAKIMDGDTYTRP